jgi:hypothetical protein
MQLKKFLSSKHKNRVSFLGVKTDASTWHNRLGHPYPQVLKRLVKDHQVSISHLRSSSILCLPCQVAKSKQLPFQDSHYVTNSPLELIHSDLWTLPLLSVNGSKFYVVFVDDFSRYTWIFPLQFKSDVFSCFVKFKCLIENMLSLKIKQLQTDGGGEYTSLQFKNYLSSHVILHRITCPHTSQQNGIAERKHRHIIETGLTLLAQSHLPPKLWEESFHTSVYLINRLPTPTIKWFTPFFKLYNKEPEYSNLKVFGCACYPLLRPYTKHKLEFWSKQCIFLGYSSNHKGYTCLDPSKNCIYISRNVVFDEKLFPALDTASNSSPASYSSLDRGMSTLLRIDFEFVNDLSPTLPTVSHTPNASTVELSTTLPAVSNTPNAFIDLTTP